MLFLFHDFLGQEWQGFKAKFWRNILLTIILYFGAIAVLSVARIGLKSLAGDFGDSPESSLLLTFLTALVPFIAPFAEELTFRYLLFGKIRPRAFKFVMFFVSAILFGLIHILNFYGQILQTVPYMFVGAYFALIYQFTKNIWNSIMVHWIFNSINSVVPVIVLIILHFVGIG